MSGSRSRVHTGESSQHAGARPVSKPHDRPEREAERAADIVGRGGSVAGWSFSALPPSGAVQRQDDPTKPLTDDEKKKEAAKKAAEAFLETKPGNELKEKVLADPLVKPVKDFVTSPGGLGLLIGGGVGGLAAAHKPLPFQAPAIPLDRVVPGLSATVRVDGPVDRPTFVGLTLTFREQGPKKKKPESGDVAARVRALHDARRPESDKLADKQAADQDVQDFLKSQKLTVPVTTGVRPSDPPKQDEPKKEDEQQKPQLQRAPSSSASAGPEQVEVDDALATPGRPLDPAMRRSMESSFGYDFSSVVIHDDAQAAATAAEIHAAAFTVGEDVVFGADRYAPSTMAGRELLAHELAHTIQQRGATAKAPAVPRGSALEASADRAGRMAAAGANVRQPLGRSGFAVARQVAGDEPEWVPDELTADELAEFLRYWGSVGGKPEDLPPIALERLEQLIGYARHRSQSRAASRAAAGAGRTGTVFPPGEDEVAPTPMALPEPGAAKSRSKRPRAALGRAPARVRAPGRETAAKGRFLPGGFTDEETDRLVSEADDDLFRAVHQQEQAEIERAVELEDKYGDPYVWGYVPNEFGTTDRVQMRRSELETAQDRAANRPALAMMEGISSGGAVTTAGLALGGIARVLRGGESKDAVPSALAYGTLGDALSLGFGAPFSGQDPGPRKSPSAYIGEPPPRETMPAPSTYAGERDGPAALADTARPAELAKTASPDALAQTALPDALAKTASPEALAQTALPEALAKTASPEALAKTVPPEALAKNAPAPARTEPESRPPPSGKPRAKTPVPATRPGRSDTIRWAVPRPPRAGGPPRVAAVSPQQVIEQYRRDPSSVYVSETHDWFEQGWKIDRGSGPMPVAIRADRFIIVDGERMPDDLRSALGHAVPAGPETTPKPAATPAAEPAPAPAAAQVAAPAPATTTPAPAAQTQPSVPPPPRAPALQRAEPKGGRVVAPTGLSRDEVIDQYRRDPKAVIVAPSSAWFKQTLAHSFEGEAPVAVRTGGLVIVDPGGWPDHLRKEIGLPEKAKP